ncbi:Protein EXPORTIN 1A isoform F [Glycine soja]|uniref:Protein EXPORTIN 1A isoform D n=1 Tax=Glycine soja TaxID=3848 RepID=A0A445M750_GLYSO|nr:Protein EXPORTIN 1A isoform D [Glycine soja]RZC31414.1 Protein EXPORTIN 1A isoform E [Glycine soja]RZC31415.1 Protein EXPORTIN 1A isoform F [Glycine soja]
MAAEKLRDLSQPIDVPLLDATVAAFYGTGSKEQRTAADQILRDLKNNPDTWLQVMHILQNTQSLNTKFFALQVLEGVIKYRWNALPVDQRDGMKKFISDVIVQLSGNEASFRTDRLYVNKLNIILVQILKHEWPVRWRSFIPDLVSAAKTSETICENCMAILKLLSEEVFDFSRGEMTQQKIKELKHSLNSEFQLIHELCLYVLSASQRTELIRATLSTLYAFLSWIPLGYIFESPLLKTLLKFFPIPAYRNLTLQCLTEVAALQFGNYYDAHIKMYNIFMGQLQTILPPTTNIPEAYSHGSSEEQVSLCIYTEFGTVLHLILQGRFIFSVFVSVITRQVHVRILESTQENISALLLGLEYLINISYVDDTEVFKVCLDYWNVLVSELFEPHRSLENPAAANMIGLQVPGMIDGIGSQLLQHRQLYAGPMSKLRMLMICRMAKPEEVLIVEDENGNIVRETMKDNDVLVQYKIMRETLIYLSHLDHDDTEKQMLRKLSKQLSGEDWTWNNLNTLCWAIGSISGSMVEEQENRFLVMVIRDLLNLCEITKGKDNKAVIASNIMYVVGQYPRFLRAHWKFLKTVVNKLFEFMHESHPGVQDMACNTFLKIVQKCKRKFVITQVGENEPFVSELLSGLPNTIADLEPHQINTFYESVGNMIQAESDAQKRDEYLQKLMVLPNQRWMEIIGKAHQNADFLKDQDVIRNVLNILQTNTSVASSLGTYFLPQITLIFLDMLNVYRMYSELISKSIAEGGPFASRTSYVKLLRSVKRETLKLVETFLDKAEDQPQIGKQFVPPMMDPVLGDYARNVPDARGSEVLSLFATIVNKYKAAMVEDVPQIFEAVFQCTLEMITKNFEDYPEHRLKFFSLLRAIATHCFPALICLSSQQLKLVMDSIIWAFRHTERNIAETGLNLLLEMLKKFQASEFCNQFYRTYFLTIEQEIFAVLTDTFHKPGFKFHVLVLQHLFCLAETGALTEPLWDAATNPYSYPSNAAFVREFTINLLSTSFPNMTASEVTQFVNGLFESTNDLPTFETHIRDFLVQSKEFSAQDNKDLYAEEAAAQRERERQRMLSIPGLVAPSELQDEMVDS